MFKYNKSVFKISMIKRIANAGFGFLIYKVRPKNNKVVAIGLIHKIKYWIVPSTPNEKSA